MTLVVHQQKQYNFTAGMKSGQGKLPPLRTFTELYEEFGVSRNSFSAALRDPNAPKPIMRKKNMSAGTNSWYNPIEVRKWWASRNKGIA